MKMKSTYAFLMFVVLGSMLNSCRPDAEFPIEPYLEYKSFMEDGQPIMVFKFTDGDGNVGLNQRDTFPPFNATTNPVNLYHWNLWMKYWVMNNGEWEEIPLIPEAAYFRIPRLDPQGQNKALQGDIIVNMTGWYPLTPDDTVRYSFVLIDRDKNHSNEAFSETIVP
jgi:hypothetical protein